MNAIKDFITQFRINFILSGGYILSIMSTMLMYTMLPILVSQLRDESVAGIAIMLMAMVQVFVFNALFAYFTDKYSARKMFFFYTGAFILWAMIRLASYHIDQIALQKILIILMMLLFSIWFGARYVDVYTVRMTPTLHTGTGFGILVMFAAGWRFLWTMLQPIISQPEFQYIAPLMMIGAMLIFTIFAYYLPDDHIAKLSEQIPDLQNKPLHYRIYNAIKTTIISYKDTFAHGFRFIKRCQYYPLIPLSITLREGIFFWSLWFIIPLYISQHPWVGTGFEIGVYELLSLCTALLFGVIADKMDNRIWLVVGWLWVLTWMILLYVYPSLSNLIRIGIILWLSNNLLYATGQHILGEHDSDHEDDGAYSQMRSLVTNIWFMFMPVIWWVLQYLDFSLQLTLFATIMKNFAIIGLIIGFYIYVIRTHIWERN